MMTAHEEIVWENPVAVMQNRWTIALNVCPGGCEYGLSPRGEERNLDSYTAIAINIFSICQETMREGCKDGFFRNTENIDLAFVCFI